MFSNIIIYLRPLEPPPLLAGAEEPLLGDDVLIEGLELRDGDDDLIEGFELRDGEEDLIFGFELRIGALVLGCCCIRLFVGVCLGAVLLLCVEDCGKVTRRAGAVVSLRVLALIVLLLLVLLLVDAFLRKSLFVVVASLLDTLAFVLPRLPSELTAERPLVAL